MIKRIIIICLLFVLFVFAGCNKNKTDGNNENNGSNSNEQIEEVYTKALQFELSDCETYYKVVGIDDTNEVDLIIPSKYNGLPVKEITSNAMTTFRIKASTCIIPETITTIPSGGPNLVFNNCLNVYDNGYYLGTKDNPYFAFIETKDYQATNCIIHPDTKIISEYAFCDEYKITEINIPEGVTHIGSYCFMNCDSLKKISVPNSLEYIGSNSFLQNKVLEYNVDEKGKYLGNETNPFLILAEIDDSNSSYIVNERTKFIITSMKNKSIEEITILENVISIGNLALSGYSNLKSINISDSVTYIGEYAFSGCSLLTEIKLPKNLTVIKDYTFAYSNIKNFTIPSNVVYIGVEAFAYSRVETVDFERNSKLKKIGMLAFKKCSNLVSFDFPNGLISIGQEAFIGCSNLESFTAPATLEKIGYNAFDNCTKLSDGNAIYIGKGDNSHYYFVRLVSNSINEYTLHEDTKVITEGAFLECSSLETVILPNGLERIEGNAFSYTEIRHITIPNSVTYIGFGAFRNCQKLKTIVLSNQITELSAYLFDNCISLVEVNIPSSVKIINNNVFDRCYSLKKVYIPWSVEIIEKKAFVFYDRNTRCSIYCEIDMKPLAWEDDIFNRNGTLGAKYQITWGYSGE